MYAALMKSAVCSSVLRLKVLDGVLLTPRGNEAIGMTTGVNTGEMGEAKSYLMVVKHLQLMSTRRNSTSPAETEGTMGKFICYISFDETSIPSSDSGVDPEPRALLEQVFRPSENLGSLKADDVTPSVTNHRPTRNRLPQVEVKAEPVWVSSEVWPLARP